MISSNNARNNTKNINTMTTNIVNKDMYNDKTYDKV